MTGLGRENQACFYAYSLYYDWYEGRRLSPDRGDHRRRLPAPLELGGQGADRGRSLDPATTASAAARRHGLHASQLFTWRQQLQRSAASSVAAIGGPAFVPVLMTEDSPAPTEAAGRMEIALGPAVVRVGADVDAAALRRVLEVVQGLP